MKKFDGIDVIAVMNSGRAYAEHKFKELEGEYVVRFLEYYPRTISEMEFKDNFNENELPGKGPGIQRKWHEMRERYYHQNGNFPDVSFKDFFYNTQLRLSEKPNLNHLVFLADDYISRGDTMEFSIYDMFKLGYEKVIFSSEVPSPSFDTLYCGDKEFFDKNFKKRDFGTRNEDYGKIYLGRNRYVEDLVKKK